MKYQASNEKIASDKRKLVNTKVLSVIRSDNPEAVSREDIFNSFTGKGGLHGLNYKDYGNYHDYGEAKKAIEGGQFFTPDSVVRTIYELLQPANDELIADLTCGAGAFCNHAPVEYNFFGCEIDRDAAAVAKHLYPLANIVCGDVVEYHPNIVFDYVVGNPPFNLKINDMRSEYLYLDRAADMLLYGGICAVVTPKSFLEDEFSNSVIRENIGYRFSFIGQYELPKDTFPGVDIETKISVWRKRKYNYGEVINEYTNEFVSLDELKKRIGEIKDWKDDNKYRLRILSHLKGEHEYSFSHQPDEEELKEKRKYGMSEGEYRFKMRKLLYEVKRTRPAKYQDCLSKIREFEGQSKPYGMSQEEWESIALTEAKVLAYVKGFLRPHKTKRPASVISAKKLRRKEREYSLITTPNCDVKPVQEIEKYINDFYLENGQTGERIRPNEIQKADLSIMLQKPVFYCQWEQGGGKTLAGIVWAEHKMKTVCLDNVIVVGPAIAIKNTWRHYLSDHGIRAALVESLTDLNSVKKGDYVLFTFGALAKLHKHIRKFVNANRNKKLLILDEADNISNPQTTRTRLVLGTFQGLKYKLLLSGTMTRNCIAEAFTQFYLLHGGKDYFVSKPRIVYEYSKKEGEIKEEFNDYFMKPYPAHMRGFNNFKACFNPSKPTVFGAEKTDSNIYNADFLKEIIDYTVITRRFEEIRGEKIYEIKQEFSEMNYYEEELYEKIINEIERLIDKYYKSTGVDRKDRLLQIIRQINLLFRACSVPQTFNEYNGKGVGRKMKKVFDMIGSMKKVAIGLTHIQSVNEYEREIRKRFPGRNVVVITGQNASISRRRKLVEEMKKMSDVVLIATQQSLSSSMNIDFIDDVILPELDWNNSKMSQFYFRFIRYTSKNKKRVYFVTHKRSLESNLLQMIINKDKLNNFMKNSTIDMDELYQKFGVENDLLGMLLRRDSDSEGVSCIRWTRSIIRNSDGSIPGEDDEQSDLRPSGCSPWDEDETPRKAAIKSTYKPDNPAFEQGLLFVA